jgi:hypothetical protein
MKNPGAGERRRVRVVKIAPVGDDGGLAYLLSVTRVGIDRVERSEPHRIIL